MKKTKRYGRGTFVSLKGQSWPDDKFLCLKRKFTQLMKLPKEKDVLGRFFYFAHSLKSKSKRVSAIGLEIQNLWKKMSLPIISSWSIKRKINVLIRKYELNRKNKISHAYQSLFDCTNINGIWLSIEERHFYHLQIETNGETGRCSNVRVLLHPSKRLKCKETNDTYTPQRQSFSDDLDTDSEESVNYTESLTATSRKKPASTEVAVKIVEETNTSTKTVAKIGKLITSQGFDFPSPTQPGIYKAVMRRSDQMKKMIKEKLNNQVLALHFDGKHKNSFENQVVVVKNNSLEYRLAVLVLQSGRAGDIFKGIESVITDFNLWSNIKIIICDTTSTNTGHKNGVVVRLQRAFKERGFDEPQYIGCQHHVLDLLLKHVTNDILEENKSSPIISYDELDELIENYDELKSNYSHNGEIIQSMSLDWREDMLFLLELSDCYRYYIMERKLPQIKFRKIPNISNARWNSRAILILLCFFLIPQHRQKLKPICNFICGFWRDAWYSDQYYDDNIFYKLFYAVQLFEKAKKCLITHWSKLPSAIETQRSNICAERAIKVIQSLQYHSKETLNKRFILSNKL